LYLYFILIEFFFNNFYSLLLQHGSDPIRKNKDAKTPYELAPNKLTRKVFRKFMAIFPDKYNYNKVNFFTKLLK